ncbi:MAG: hypothetical protein ACMG6H_09565 [Acidobacteriota bacterium]
MQALEGDRVRLRQRLDVLAPGFHDGGHIYAGELELLHDLANVYNRDDGLFHGVSPGNWSKNDKTGQLTHDIDYRSAFLGIPASEDHHEAINNLGELRKAATGLAVPFANIASQNRLQN